MSTDAQKRASTKYNKENTVQYCIRLNKNTDKNIIERLENIDNKTRYIKHLIITDILSEILQNQS